MPGWPSSSCPVSASALSGSGSSRRWSGRPRPTTARLGEPGGRTVATGSASALLDDADLAILASPPERYAEYVAGVRAEYAHVPEAAFRAGRRQILQGFLDRPRIYRTPAAYDAWEATARAQVAAEVRALS